MAYRVNITAPRDENIIRREKNLRMELIIPQSPRANILRLPFS